MISRSAETTITLTATRMLQAVFEHIPVRITLDPNGGILGVTYVMTEGDGTADLPLPSRAGYYFAGWYTEDGEAVLGSTVFTEPCTLIAHWTAAKPETQPSPPSPLNPLVIVPSMSHGHAELSPAEPKAGDTVTVTLVPDPGYSVSTFKVTTSGDQTVDTTRQDEEHYTFVVPGTGAALFATFSPIAIPFADVEDTDWFVNSVKYVYHRHLMTGKTVTRFAPDDTSTRAEVATLLWRMESNRAPARTPDTFPDVPIDAWYAGAVRWATASGIVEGYGNGTFGPGDTITREQFAVMLYRYAVFQGMPTAGGADSLNTFPDRGSVSSWARTAMGWAVDNGIVTGTGSGRLNPGGSATRAQLAAMVERFLKL